MPTTADINYIEDKNGDVFFPVTHVGAVIDDDNNALNSILAGKQNTLTAGTNVTISNNVISATGTKGDDGVGISSVVQTTESTVSGGTNVITVTKTDGTSSTFNVRNGDAVGSATIVQTTGDSTTSVMSQDAVSNSIEVWRDDVDCAYEAENLVFDGTNTVDTGVNPRYPKKPLLVYMEIEDLDFGTTMNSDYLDIISTTNNVSYNVSNYFVRKNSATQITVTRGGAGAQNFDVNVGSGSKNVFILKVDEDACMWECTVNGITKTSTYARNEPNNISWGNFILGGTRGKSSFTLKKVKILDLSGILNEPDVQLFDSYTKGFPIYPTTRFDCVDGLFDIVNAPQAFGGTLAETIDLDSLTSTNFLDTDAITIIYDYRDIKINSSYGDLFWLYDTLKQNYLILRTSGWQLNSEYKIDGGSASYATINNYNTSSVSYFPLLVCVSLNFSKNTITSFKNGALVGTSSFDFSVFPSFSTFKYANFASPSDYKYTRYFGIMNGEMDENYAKEMYELYPNNIFSSKTECLSFAEPSVVSLADFSASGAGTITKSSSSFTYSDSGTNSNCYLAKTGLITDYELLHTTLVSFDIEVTSGSMSLTGFGVGGGVTPTVFDSNGNLINVGATTLSSGNSYHVETRRVPNHPTYLIRFQYTDGITFTITNLKKQSLGPVIALSPYTYHRDYFELFNGDRIKTSGLMTIDKSIYKPPTVFSGDYPSYNGQMKMEDGKVYVGYAYGSTVVWKQINNS